MPQKRRMSALDYETVRPFLNISTARINAARAALVDGLTLQTIADANGWTSRQTVNDAVDVVCEMHERQRKSQQAMEAYRLQTESDSATSSKKKPGA